MMEVAYHKGKGVMRMKNKKILIISIIAVLILVMSGTVYAYFTTYATASGSVRLNLLDTEISVAKSEFENGKFNIELENIGDAEAFVRVKVLIPDFATVTSDSANWTLNNDGYWYYNPILEAGAPSDILQLNINMSGNETKEFNVVTNVEASRVWYNEDGSTYADWKYTFGSTEE